jgi:enediyne biosynthesis protein E4
MSRSFFANKWALGAASLLTASVIGIAVHHLANPGEGNPKDKVVNTTPGFVECAEDSGIAFHMDFLPSEQGVLPFKINLYDHGCGVAVGDFDGDGFDDVFFVNQLGPCALYRNKGNGTFEDVTEKAGVGLGDRICVAATWCDYDNDGHPDLYVTSTRGGNVLFHNNGNGTFTDVTEKAGVKCVAHSQTAVFFDYNNDGYPDLFVTNTAQWTLNKAKGARFFAGPDDFWDMAKSVPEEHLLFRNNGDGTFTNVTKKSGLGGKGWGGDVAVFDYDEDGWLDLFVTNMFGASQLYRNNHDGTFTDITKGVLGRTPWGAIGCRAFDFNNDGRLDLFITDMHSDMWWPFSRDPSSVESTVLKKKYPHVMGYSYQFANDAPEIEKRYAATFKIDYEAVVFGNTFFKKLSATKFEEVSDKANLETFWPWGIATGDFDNDGYEDIFIPAGMGFPYSYWPNSLLMNNGNETFTDKAATLGFDPPPGGPYLDRPIADKRAARSSRAAAVADFRRVGRLDIVVNNFNDRAHYFRNDLAPKNYIQFRLTGAKRKGDPATEPVKKSNRDAIGALVTIHMGDEVMVRQVQAAGGYLSQSSNTLHFGLGDRKTIDRVEIRWPSGLRERIDGPAINKRHELAETPPKPLP